MQRCPQCGWTIGTSEVGCPRCRESSGESVTPHADWTVIARFANAAEAGYFAHELAALLDLDPRIIDQDDLNSFSHAWRTVYLLSVPTAQAERAIEVLKALIEATGDPSDGEPSFDDFTKGRTNDGAVARSTGDSRINWVPIILTLTAGTFVLWAAKKPAAAPEGKHAADDLWNTLVAHPEPWVQRAGNGRVVRRLMVDEDHQRIVIEEDRDGDGVFESEAATLTHR